MPSFVELIPAEETHIASIAGRMREWDAREAQAMGHSPEQALMLGLKASVDCYTAMIDGEPEAMLGLVPRNVLEGEGQPWLLGTDVLFAHPRAMLVLSRKVVRIWGDSLPRHRNLVGAENVLAIRYLRKLGYSIGEDRVAVNGIDFVTFERETSDL